MRRPTSLKDEATERMQEDPSAESDQSRAEYDDGSRRIRGPPASQQPRHEAGHHAGRHEEEQDAAECGLRSAHAASVRPSAEPLHQPLLLAQSDSAYGSHAAGRGSRGAPPETLRGCSPDVRSARASTSQACLRVAVQARRLPVRSGDRARSVPARGGRRRRGARHRGADQGRRRRRLGAGVDRDGGRRGGRRPRGRPRRAGG